ncbi:MAG: thioredoxin family protein [Acidobacteriota bacterium]
MTHALFPGSSSRLSRNAAVGVILALLLSVPALAQMMPADSLLRDFQLTGDVILEVDGQVVEKAEIYQSQRAAGFLILSSALPEPTLIMPRAGSVESVSVMKLARRDGGSIDILADAELTPHGRFTPKGQNIAFSVGGKAAVLKPKPYLLGLQDAQALLDYSPEYQRTADNYTPDAQAMAALKAQGRDVKVRVYFGSWCPACARAVPPLLQVANELEGSSIDFEFYGLPTPFGDEPAAKKDDVGSVPTGIVYVDGKEVGRLRGGPAWRLPELTLDDIVAGRYQG